MGDVRRFDLMASFVFRNFPKTARIADVAGGKGYLQMALRQRGFQHVHTFDKRKGRRDRPTMRYSYRFFDDRVAEPFDLIVGMHPDQATDVIIQEAHKRKVPFVICPCCIMPKAYSFWGQYSYGPWCDHLASKAAELGFRVIQTNLPMTGRSRVIAGWPQ